MIIVTESSKFEILQNRVFHDNLVSCIVAASENNIHTQILCRTQYIEDTPYDVALENVMKRINAQAPMVSAAPAELHLVRIGPFFLLEYIFMVSIFCVVLVTIPL